MWYILFFIKLKFCLWSFMDIFVDLLAKDSKRILFRAKFLRRLGFSFHMTPAWYHSMNCTLMTILVHVWLPPMIQSLTHNSCLHWKAFLHSQSHCLQSSTLLLSNLAQCLPSCTSICFFICHFLIFSNKSKCFLRASSHTSLYKIANTFLVNWMTESSNYHQEFPSTL
jgi:hypothetical protein